MKQHHFIYRYGVLILLLSVASACAQTTQQAPQEPALQRIAFGSCSNPRKPVPAFLAIAQTNPDLMIFVGDNVYADTTDERKLRRAYKDLGENPGFGHLKNICPILATWDDHDYGLNDAGVELPSKVTSQRVFLEFWEVPKDSPRHTREGIYGAHIFGPQGQRVQVILLDTRYHRDLLTPIPRNDRDKLPGRYIPNPDPDITILGKAQWTWLKEQLAKPADVRLIASSIQFVPVEHGWEGWMQFPAERTRFIELIRATKANGVIFLSGDRHHAEISRLDEDAPYPLYDITSSGMNQPGGQSNERNRHRVGPRYYHTNFGLITLDWNQPAPAVTLQIIDPQGNVQIQQHIPLADLAPPR
jgi:alkaline phosphatase D